MFLLTHIVVRLETCEMAANLLFFGCPIRMIGRMAFRSYLSTTFGEVLFEEFDQVAFC